MWELDSSKFRTGFIFSTVLGKLNFKQNKKGMDFPIKTAGSDFHTGGFGLKAH